MIGSGFATSGKWDSCVLGGVGIINSFANNPQYWGGSGSTVDLPYDTTGDTTCLWSDVGMKAKVIRSFRFHLVAMNIEDCDGYNSRKVHWSTPADPGTVPVTWDITKPDYGAGQNELSETPGAIIDGLSLRDTFQIYKEDAIYCMTFTGDRYLFNFRVVTTSYGLFASNCVCDVGGRHVFVGDGDIYIYDGTNFDSIADERVKDLFFDNVSRTNKDICFVTYYERTGEVWLCYPSAGNIACNKALVWNSKDNTWSPRNCQGSRLEPLALSTGRLAGITMSGDGNWDIHLRIAVERRDHELRGFLDDTPYKESLILGGATDLFEMDRTNKATARTWLAMPQRGA